MLRTDPRRRFSLDSRGGAADRWWGCDARRAPRLPVRDTANRHQNRGTTSLLSTNTNLEQISDWLTTILIGLGLVQLGTLSDGVRDVADDLALALGPTQDTAEAVSLTLIVYMLIFGFIAAYIVTRIGISLRLKEVEEYLSQRSAVLESTLEPLPPPPVLTPEVAQYLPATEGDPPGEPGPEPREEIG
jgi:hypothetical protein